MSVHVFLLGSSALNYAIRQDDFDRWLAVPPGSRPSFSPYLLSSLGSMVDFGDISHAPPRLELLIAIGSSMVVMFRRLAKSDNEVYIDILATTLHAYSTLLRNLPWRKCKALAQNSISFGAEAKDIMWRLWRKDPGSYSHPFTMYMGVFDRMQGGREPCQFPELCQRHTLHQQNSDMLRPLSRSSS